MNDLAGIMVETANLIFHQDWKRESKFDIDIEESDDDCTGTKTEGNSEVGERRKKRKYQPDKIFVFPSGRSINKWPEDASYLNLRYIGNKFSTKRKTQ